MIQKQNHKHEMFQFNSVQLFLHGTVNWNSYLKVLLFYLTEDNIYSQGPTFGRKTAIKHDVSTSMTVGTVSSEL